MQKYVKECALRRKLFNQLQELRGNIRVYCRARPIIQFEKDLGQTDIVVPGQEGEMQLADPESKQKKSFEFDRFFKPGTTQSQVYEETNPLVQVRTYGWVGRVAGRPAHDDGADAIVRSIIDIDHQSHTHGNRHTPPPPRAARAATGAV
eukprot:COSAG01_NODE_1003_length_12216_cov_8.565350_13_plen_149_part_00